MIVDLWRTDRLTDAPVRIYPDGCRDVVWVRRAGRAPFWKLSPLDTAMRVLACEGGAELRGFRLAPGTSVDDGLLAALNPEAPDETAAIAELARLPADADEMMQAFRDSPEGGVGRAARRLGVSLRSLQRRAVQRTGQSPLFWLRLLRLRRALAAARAGAPLAEAAAEAGFSDQAHFTREARRHYAAPPARLLADAQAMAAILAPGL